MRKLFTLFLILMGLAPLVAQDFQGFEPGDTWAFTANPGAYSEASNSDIWGPRASLSTIMPATGTMFWGIRDINNGGSGGNFDHVLTFNYDVTTLTMATISFKYNAIGFDGGDDLKYEVFHDGVGQGEVIVVDGLNGGGVSTGGWITEVINVPDAVDNVTLELRAIQNGGSDYGGFDDVEIDGLVPAPIELSSFSAAPNNKTVALNWTTESEINNELFQIEHSRNGVDFRSIGQVEGAGTTTESQAYSFAHETPAKGNNYYRLRQIDYSRDFSFSGVEVVSLESLGALEVFPTMINDFTTVVLEEGNDTKEIKVLDITGQVLKNMSSKESGNMEINLGDLSAGTYFISVIHLNTLQTAKVIKL